MERDFTRINSYLNELEQDPYAQPEDAWHTEMTGRVIREFIHGLASCQSVLDLGCGEGFAQPLFEAAGITYRGIGMGESLAVGKAIGRNVEVGDFSFLPDADNSYDLLFARHSLEHSPMALLTLFEWWRVSRKYLCVVLPAPEYWLWGGRNHYSVMSYQQAIWLFKRSGWKPLKESIYCEGAPKEYWFLLEKTEKSIE